MVMQLFGHPFSSYTWKALLAFHETGTPFEFRMLDGEHADNGAKFSAAWPVSKFPLLIDGDLILPEASIIVEYVAPEMIPGDAAAAREVRLLDRVFDNYVMTNMQAVVAEHLPHLTAAPDPVRIERAKAALDIVYTWLDERLAGREWAAGDAFTLADCAAAPSLFYADWVQPNDGRFPTLAAYRARLLSRPSVMRVVDDARPYRHFFPLGAPDRD